MVIRDSQSEAGDHNYADKIKPRTDQSLVEMPERFFFYYVFVLGLKRPSAVWISQDFASKVISIYTFFTSQIHTAPFAQL